MSLIIDYAGVERTFHLGFGQILDIEEACGKVGIGTVYKHLMAWEFRAIEVQAVVVQGLVGGGLPVAEARQLVAERIDTVPLDQHVNIAIQLLFDMMEGAPAAKGTTKDGEDKPFDKGRLFYDFAQLGLSPNDVRDMRLADLLHLYQGSKQDKAIDAPSDEAIEKMRERVDSGALDWAFAPSKPKPAKKD